MTGRAIGSKAVETSNIPGMVTSVPAGASPSGARRGTTRQAALSVHTIGGPGTSKERRMSDTWVVVGLDNGGTCNNATVLDSAGKFLVDRLVEVPSRVTEGPEVAVAALAEALDGILALTGTDRARVRAVGLDTPGPASADGVISSKGATNFAQPAWWGFDVRTALEDRLGLPVVYNNDGN